MQCLGTRLYLLFPKQTIVLQVGLPEVGKRMEHQSFSSLCHKAGSFLELTVCQDLQGLPAAHVDLQPQVTATSNR